LKEIGTAGGSLQIWVTLMGSQVTGQMLCPARLLQVFTLILSIV